MDKMFEYATRNKIRFPFKGLVSVEDLWDLSLTNLDAIYKVLNKEAKQAEDESLLNKKTTADDELNAKIDIVKYIVGVKLAERDAREKDAIKKEQKQKILEAIAVKQNEELQKSSIDDLKKMLAELD